MTPSRPITSKAKCTPCLGVLLGGLVMLVFVSGWVVMVVEKVFGGAGMEHCCSIEGVPFNYIGIFVLLCGLLAAILLAVVLQIRDWRLRRDFERKFGVKVPPETSDPSSNRSSDQGPSLHGFEHHDGN